MTWTIRPFTPDDYPAVVALFNSAWPDEPTTVEAFAREDETLPDYCRLQRWVAEQAGEVVGVGQYAHLAGRYHPRKYWLDFAVRPDLQRQGIGAALYEQVMDALRPLDPLLVRVALREDMDPCIRFVTARSFAEEWRSWGQILDLSGFDIAAHDLAGHEARLRAEGIEIKPWADLLDDPASRQKLFDLFAETRADAPMPDPATPMTFEWFEVNMEPKWSPAACFVALHQGEYVAFSSLESQSGLNAPAEIGFTGVKRAYRGKQLSLVVKLKGIACAQEHGYPAIRTTNNSLNFPMIAVNQRLGFQKEWAFVYFTKQLGTADEVMG